MEKQGHSSAGLSPLPFEMSGCFDKYPCTQCATGKLKILRTSFLLYPRFGSLLLLPLMTVHQASIRAREVATHTHKIQGTLLKLLHRMCSDSEKLRLFRPRWQLKSEAEGSRQAPESPKASLVEKSIAQFTLRKYRQGSEC